MGISSLLISLFRYKAWMNEECLKAIEQLRNVDDAKLAQLHIDHTYVVDQIFAAHLQGVSHSYSKSFNEQPLPFEQLKKAVSESDAWLIDYVRQLNSDQLNEIIDFMYTDGDLGRMSREEILAHLINHGTYHRGIISPIMQRNSVTMAADLFTGYLGRIRPQALAEL